MPSYRCYLLNSNNRIAGPPEMIDVERVSDVIDIALAMLKAWPHYAGVEVWDGVTRVYPPVEALPRAVQKQRSD